MTDDDGPLLRVVRGDPTAEELAALVSVVAAYAAAGSAPRAPRAAGGWADRRHALSRPLAVGPGAWVASGREKGLRTRADW